MENAVPTDFDLDANLNANIGRRTHGSLDTGGFGGVVLNFHVDTFNNHTGQDLRQLADELSTRL
jgi:hypothetical protein